MIKILKRSATLFLLALLVTGVCVSCRERFEPQLPSLEKNFLVVEGNLNAGHDSTVIRLTRTFKLNDTARLKVENSAQVTVEGSDNTSRALNGRGNGFYTSPDLNLVINTNYRIRIKTTDGKVFLSDFVKARKTPLIDSISWERENAGVRVFANTKDLSGTTRYYRWDFDETWEIHSYYYSSYIYQGNGVRQRNIPAEEVYYCWKYNTSPTIALANSTRLQNDVISKAPIVLIENRDEKLSVRYSILVRQYALDKEAYNFYELMKKNTEDIGTIFTPQPSEIRGNIHCVTDPNEYVLGYITASTVESKRIFIRVDNWGFQEDCIDVRVPDIPDSVRYYFASGSLIPYSYSRIPDNHYQGSYPACVNCTYRGGSLARPSYW